jgi:hypothetical protein
MGRSSKLVCVLESRPENGYMSDFLCVVLTCVGKGHTISTSKERYKIYISFFCSKLFLIWKRSELLGNDSRRSLKVSKILPMLN